MGDIDKDKVNDWLVNIKESGKAEKFLKEAEFVDDDYKIDWEDVILNSYRLKKSDAETNALTKKLLANILRNFREELGMTKKDLAAVVGLPYSVLNNIENERASFTHANLITANHNFNRYIEYNNLDFKKNSFALCMLNALSTNAIRGDYENIIVNNYDIFPETRWEHSLGNFNVSKSITEKINGIIDLEKEKFYKTFTKLSEVDQAKIMERMEFIISTYEDEKSIPTKRIAVLGQTACGNPIEAISYADEFIETNELKATFALRAVGDSMAPIINDGDVVLVKQTEELEIGDIGIFQINESGFSDDEEVTCKVLKSIKDGVMTLAPLNAAHDPIMVDAKTNQVKVIGKYLGRA
jgi:repressor LexA